MDELAMLEAQANAVDAEAVANDPSAEPEIEVQAIDPAAEVSALVQTVAGILAPAFPCLATIYTESTCNRLGNAAAPVLEKYGLTVGGFFDEWGPEIGLAAAVIPLAIATAQGIRADLAKRRKPVAETEKAEKAPADPPRQSETPADSSLAWGAMPA